MRVCRRLGLERVASSLRRLHCPVHRDALVLEVGSGANPYFRTNVLLDAFEATRQRHWAPLSSLIAPLSLAKSSDYLFVTELQRLARAGYIEVPDAFMERLDPYCDHRLEITVRDETFVIRKLVYWQADTELAELYEAEAKKYIAGRTIPKHPFAFHVRCYWGGEIQARVVNSEVDADWAAPAGLQVAPAPRFRARINATMLALARVLLSQRSRNRQLKLDSVLACPLCRSVDLDIGAALIHCCSCAADYPMRNGLPVMFADTGKHVPA